MFEAAGDITSKEIRAYREFAFPSALGDPSHDPFFSVENAPVWITSHGYQLYLQHNDADDSLSMWDPENATMTQLRAYRNCAYMNTINGNYDDSRAPSRAGSSLGSCASSRANSVFSLAGSRPISRASFIPPSRAASSRASSPCDKDVIVISDSDSDGFPATVSAPLVVPKIEPLPAPPLSIPPPIAPTRAKGRKGKQKAASSKIQLTREEAVDEIIELSSIPSTWAVPRIPTAYRVDLSHALDLLKVGNRTLKIDRYLRKEGKFRLALGLLSPELLELQDQDSWGGSGGHSIGDALVTGLFPGQTEALKCRRSHLKCNGVWTCEFIDPGLFAGCERYEPDAAAMRELWKHELDANEREAASAPGIISRFNLLSGAKSRAMEFRYSNTCQGTAYGKQFFIGCSEWTRALKLEHRYLPIPTNVDEDTLRIAMENGGQLPTAPTVNEMCALTVHPRIGKSLQTCPYTHIIQGQIKSARLVQRKCETRMIIFVPVDPLSPARHKALVILRGPHNHPAHPKTKPSMGDQHLLGQAIGAAGTLGLTVSRLLNVLRIPIAPSTSLVYGGEQVSAGSPAYIDHRRVKEFITEHKKKEHPHGMGWAGVLHHFDKEVSLLPADRYLHTTMSKNGFRLAVTMHPQIALLIHQVLSLNIDFTFKRVDGDIDEWEVASMSDRFKERITFASLFCDAKTTEAFTQLFTELFDTIARITGKPLKLAPFFPDAKCRIVMLDGEVPQALGLGHFLVVYNDPELSGINSRKPHRATATLPQNFHIDELPRDIPRTVIMRLKSIMSLDTQHEIDAWHAFCAAQAHNDIKNWYAHKRANPWILPSVNKFLSAITNESWDITPNHSNLVETAHAGRNAETSIGVGLLTAILQSQARDNAKAAELLQIEQKGVMRKRWNGVGEREKLSAQRKVWRMRKSAVRTDQLTSFESLKAERTADEMKLDSHRSDLREQINTLRREIEEEKDARRAWRVRQNEIDSELERIRKGPLAGVRINGRRPAERRLEVEPGLGISFCQLPETPLTSYQILHLNQPSNLLKFQLHFKICPATMVIIPKTKHPWT
ncbi:hypothetical protein B0H14DRAFT_2611872 [Mycena olivaceomarginata]|nr:hypothetical protein B0H14DRAFT_2611872 [Mycena olivaceomarginata]